MTSHLYLIFYRVTPGNTPCEGLIVSLRRLNPGNIFYVGISTDDITATTQKANKAIWLRHTHFSKIFTRWHVCILHHWHSLHRLNPGQKNYLGIGTDDIIKTTQKANIAIRLWHTMSNLHHYHSLHRLNPGQIKLLRNWYWWHNCDHTKRRDIVITLIDITQ